MAHPDIDTVADKVFYATLLGCIAFVLTSLLFVL